MIYPKGIVDFIHSRKDLKEKYGHNLLGQKMNVSDLPQNLNEERHSSSEFTSHELNAWMREEGYKESVEIRKYLYFLSIMYEMFNKIHSFWPEMNPNSKSEKDKYQIASSAKEMLDMASYMYYLDSYGIRGDVLECGCFKGYSSSCLSLACDFLGKKLIVADSFEGLPESGHSFYQKGDFKGGLSEVKNNISTFGKIDRVEFIEGWFNKSLIGFNRPICLLWMDVDLHGSVLDVLNNVFKQVVKDGVIFSHEMSPNCIDGDQIMREPKHEVGKAISDFFKKEKLSYKIKYLTGNSGLIIPNAKDGQILFSSQDIDMLVMENMKELSKTTIFDSLPEIPDETGFCIDSINEMIITPESSVQNNVELIIKGWAVDINAKDVAGGVAVMIDGDLYPAVYGYKREDVKIAYNFSLYRYCGFEARIPAGKIKQGDHSISLKILSNDKKAYYAPSRKKHFKVLI